MSAVNPIFGKIVLVGLLAVFGALVLVPFVMFARLAPSLRPPLDAQSSEYQIYLSRLSKRLRRNPHLAGTHLKLIDRDEIEAALKILDAHVNGIIKKTASNIFVSTAISQNGRLDALMVLAAQTQMIWQIARVYNQRPSLRDMIRLYSNVGVTVFVASQIEDFDISERVEPVIKAAISGSLASAVPGIAHISTIPTHSILDGTANAYLTLRVGVVCRTYCGSLAAFDSKSARLYGSAKAAAMLGSIVAESAAIVAKAILTAAKRAGASTIESTAASIRGVGERLNPFKKEH